MQNYNGKTWRYNLFRNGALVFWVLVVGRLLQIQFTDLEGSPVNVEYPWTTKVVVPPERGKIVDRNVELLACNIPTLAVVADPSLVENKDHAADVLSALLGESRRDIFAKLNSSGRFVVVTRRIPFEMRDRIESLGIPGLSCQVNLTRKYPKKTIASQLVGFTDIDGVGISGLEKSFDFSLRGIPGKMMYQKTARNEMFSRSVYPSVPAEDGHDIVLTIDYRYQHIVEEELNKTIEQARATGGVAMVMNPQNGEILAMASEPGFDANHPDRYDANCWRLKAITDPFEPGSTFKLVVMSAVLNEGLSTPEDTVFCENGRYELMDVVIHDTKSHGKLAVRDALIYSSNIGMAKLAMGMNKRTLYEYIKAFGFGNKYDFDVIGEREGILHPIKDWSGVSPAFLAMGHEITATTLQMCNMYCTVANGGFLMRPTIIKEVRKDGTPLVMSHTKVIRRVISETTADTLKSIMADVVNRGTGVKAQIDGIKVCGKTGTAQMPHMERNYIGYQDNNYIASFGGFFPEEQPKLCVFVMVEKPRVGYYGGDISAPCFKRISERIIALEGVDYFKPGYNLAEKIDNDRKVVPNLVGTSRQEIEKIKLDEEFITNISGQGEYVLAQDPNPGTVVDQGAPELFLTTNQHQGDEKSLVPNVTDLPLRNALNVLASRKIHAVVDGSGKVVKQKPAPGSRLEQGEQVLLQCETALNLKDLLVIQ